MIPWFIIIYSDNADFPDLHMFSSESKSEMLEQLKNFIKKFIKKYCKDIKFENVENFYEHYRNKPYDTQNIFYVKYYFNDEWKDVSDEKINSYVNKYLH